MSDTFASQATRLAGIICRSLGWQPDDFWLATPTEIATMFAREGEGQSDGLSRGELEFLMERDENG